MAPSFRLPVAITRGTPSSVSTESGSPLSPSSVSSPGPGSSASPKKAWSKVFQRLPANHGTRFGKADRFDPDEPFFASNPNSPKNAKSPAAPETPRPASAPPKRRPNHQANGQQRPNLKELLPAEVKDKVLSLAGRQALVIEMLWSTSGYLPSHDNGRKYQSTAQELLELMKDRLSGNCPIPVLTMTEPVKIKEMEKGVQRGMYDRYSQQERSAGCVASNSSYASGIPSRIGAFEIHLVHDSWDPQLCSATGSASHDSDGKDVHRGPPVITSSCILCSACAERAAGAAAAASRRVAAASPESRDKQMQHSLLHSKLWSRRWPGLPSVASLVGALVIEAPPEVPPPEPIGMFDCISAKQLEQYRVCFQDGQNEAEDNYHRICLFLIESFLPHGFGAHHLEQGLAGAWEAEKIYVGLCHSMISRLPGHNLDLQLLECGTATAAEAFSALRQAVRLNDGRRAVWKAWFCTIDSWKKDDSAKEKELLERILSYRKDLRDGLTCGAREKVEALEALEQRMYCAAQEQTAPACLKPQLFGASG